MIDTNGKREPGKSVQAARLDDDDDIIISNKWEYFKSYNCVLNYSLSIGLEIAFIVHSRLLILCNSFIVCLCTQSY